MKMNSPKISIIVPVYNVEPYLHTCIDSILNQTLRDIEVICVDDGSSDKSGAILDEYAARDSRISVIHKENSGLADTRNVGMNVASGEFLLFVDSDDYIAHQLCQQTYAKAIETSADMTLFFYARDLNGTILPVTFPRSELWGKSSLENLKAAFELGPNVWKFLWKREFVQRNVLQFHEGLIYEDVPFTARGVMCAECVALVPEVFYFYRVNSNSIMETANSPNYCGCTVRAFNFIFEDLHDLKLSEEITAFILTQKLIFTYYGYMRTEQALRSEFRRNIRNGVLPHELEMLRERTLDVLPLIRYFFLSIYGRPIEKWIGKMKVFKFHVFRIVEKFFHIHIYPKE